MAQVLRRSSFWNKREVALCLTLPPPGSGSAGASEYLLIPSTYHPDTHAAFSLVVRSAPQLRLTVARERWPSYRLRLISVLINTLD
jgi:hypothetical protein|eukprot:COSAG01_NODE_4508_length_4967_cov_4.284100_5_plen_86_part_00